MMLISHAYRKQNRKLHHAHAGYGSHGHLHAAEVAEWAKHYGAQSVLDYGCGKATLAEALAEFVVVNYDPVTYPKEPGQQDFVACLDVLEHVEPECLDAVLKHMRTRMRYAGLLVIATRPAGKLLPDGRNAHLIVEPATWWRSRLEAAGLHVEQVLELTPDSYTVVVRP